MIEDIFTDALLSAAAYADWSLLGTVNEFKIKNELLDNRGFTEEQYKTMFDTQNPSRLFEVYQTPSVGYTSTSNGFSATIFKNRQTGKLTVAFRGTDGVADFVFANFLLTLGIGSIADIFDKGQISKIESFFINAGLADADGILLVDANSVDFVGHSLGGHLATIAAYKYPGMVDSVDTYNGAGLKGWDEIWNTYIAGSVSGGTLDPNRVTNYYADKGIELTADQDLWFNRPGGRQEIFIEEGILIDNHSIAKLVESLSVYRVLAALDTKLDNADGLGEIYGMLDASTNNPKLSLEEVIWRLGSLLGGVPSENTGDVELFYQALMDDEGALKPEYQGLTITQAATDTSDISYRYALLHLNPFVVKGFDYSDHNQNHELDLYDPETGTGMTDIYIQARAEMLKWVMLYNTKDMGYGDGYNADSIHGNWDYSDSVLGVTLKIDGGGVSFSDHQIIFGSSAGKLHEGSGDSDKIFGMDGNDTLKGKGGNDYLEGGKGDDTYIFNSGDGADTIIDVDGIYKLIINGQEVQHLTQQAPGSSVYSLADVLGNPIGETNYTVTTTGLLINVDGPGTDDSINIIGWNKDSNNAGIELNDADTLDIPSTPLVYHLGWDPDPETGKNRKSNHSASVWSAKSHSTEIIYADGTENLSFSGLAAGGMGDTYMFGDGDSNVFIDDFQSTAGFGKIPTSLDWLLGHPFWDQIVRDEYFFSMGDQVGNDEIHGGGGDDLLISHGGDDWLYGDDGDDILIDNPGMNYGDDLWMEQPGNHSDDHLFGGEGSDQLYSDQGYDYLSGGNGNDYLFAGANDDILEGGEGDDYLLGDSAINNVELPEMANILLLEIDAIEDEEDYGSDTLLGGVGNDHLAGGAGNDWLWGGEDNDIIWGDGAGIMTPGHIQIIEGNGDVAGDDYLYGEAGNDTLFGGGGNDYLYGGKGDDILQGEDGADHLYGGEGSDWLYGENGDDIVFGYAGDDYIEGGEGLDYIYGGLGSDFVFGDDGDDLLYGGSGNDRLEGGEGKDIIVGDAGKDHLYGNDGSDTFVFSYGDGIDVIHDSDGTDFVQFSGVNPNNINASSISSTDGVSFLKIQYGGSDIVYIKGGLAGGIVSYEFGKYGTWTTAELLANTLAESVDYRMAGAGTVYGGSYNDTLVGSEGGDVLYGQDGDDILVGGVGDDLLYGEAGLDIYRVGLGTGIDRIFEQAGSANRIELLSGVTVEELSYERQGDDLCIYIKDGSDGVVIDDYFNLEQVWAIADQDGGFVMLDQENEPTISHPWLAESVETAWRQFGQKIQSAYSSLLLVSGFQQEDSGKFTRSYFSHLNKNNYQVDYSSHEIDGVSGSYTRTLGDYDTQLISTVKEEISSQVHFPGAGASYVDAGGSGRRYVSISDGSVKYQLGDIFVPVFGPNKSRDPMTGYLSQEVKGYWIYPQGAFVPSDQTETKTYRVRDYSVQINTMSIIAGAGDDEIDTNGTCFNLIDAGTGNDVIRASKDTVYVSVPGGQQQRAHIPGSLLFGNNGDDLIYGSALEDVLIGGEGNDFMSGGKGDDTYYLFDWNGGDKIFDLPVGVFNFGGVDEAGLKGNDILVLPDGVHFEDLAFEWGVSLETVDYLRDSWLTLATQSSHTTFNISWSGSEGVTIVLPHSEESAGFGIDRLQLSTGESLSFSDVMASADSMLDQDIHQQDNIISGEGVLYGAGGDDWLTATGSKSSMLIGGDGVDFLEGGEGDDELFGGELVVDDWHYDNEHLVGALWDSGNTFSGGAGRDVVWVTGGSDTILFNLGDGEDIVTDLLHEHVYFDGNYYPEWLDVLAADAEHSTQLHNCHDTLRFGVGINPWDITVDRVDDDLEFSHANGQDVVHFENWFRADINQLNRVEFAAGTVWDLDDINAMLDGEFTNQSPIVDIPLADQTVSEDSLLTLQVPEGTFLDPGDVLSLSADLSDGSPLPDWLRFDSATNILNGTPDNSQVGSVDIRITATDSHGESVFDIFTLDITNVNDAPVLAGAVSDQSATEGQNFNFALPGNLFADADAGDSLTLSAALVDGTSLPTWLGFDAVTGIFSGTPTNDDVGDICLKIVVSDLDGATAETTFNLNIANVNDAPELMSALADIEAVEGDSLSYIVPADTFRDIDQGDSLTYTASLANGESLPSWISFDPVTLTLSSDLPMDAAGEYDISIQATDQSGDSVSDAFNLSVTNLIQNSTWWNWYRGTSLNDLIVGSENNEWLMGYDGNDQLHGGAGRDHIYGGSGDDVLVGDDGSDRRHTIYNNIFGRFHRGLFGYRSNNDMLCGGDGNDQLQGGVGNDTLYGGDGDDVLEGGVGNDILKGGSGSDTYKFSLLDGKDIINNYDSKDDDHDVLSFDGIASSDLLFSKQWNNLVIDVVSSDDKVTVRNWFRGDRSQLDTIETSDLVLENDMVNQLVNAMAQFDVPSGAGTVATQERREQYESVLAASW